MQDPSDKPKTLWDSLTEDQQRERRDFNLRQQREADRRESERREAERDKPATSAEFEWQKKEAEKWRNHCLSAVVIIIIILVLWLGH